ncbi:hypothetical protein [Sphingomonas aracearum]|uniref:Alpha/beta hydrolase n=1 Tax=Sphingomonas aracearum TaxID=2283317 RepID=A0A369VY82_9SPHN|nr:hypothetical protein [Sphingomonas aracearum]RDE06585.1 hypothetical protein DVW87_02435 [Sphingomonas aracearum]
MRIEHYGWSGGRETVLRFGPAHGPLLVAVLPLFEEANRTRTFLVRTLRLLAERGVASALPDLPGTGESALPSAAFRPFAAREALEALAGGTGERCYMLGVRSGCLLDGFVLAHGRYHLAPVAGERLVRDLGRVRQAEAGGRERAGERWFMEDRWQEAPGHVRVGGMLLSAEALLDLSLLEPFQQADVPRRVARLATDAAPADVYLQGSPLWRTKEPQDDPVLAAALADDVAAWIAACEG